MQAVLRTRQAFSPPAYSDEPEGFRRCRCPAHRYIFWSDADAACLIALCSIAASLPTSTFHRFIVLLSSDKIIDSLRPLLPHVTPSLDSTARIQAQLPSASSDSAATLERVATTLQGAGYREVRIEGNEVLATAPAKVTALPLRRKKIGVASTDGTSSLGSSGSSSTKKSLWAFTDSSASTSRTPPTIDESTLLTSEDLKRAQAVQRPDCDVKKTRKACKNCSCGLRELLLEEQDDWKGNGTNGTSGTSTPAAAEADQPEGRAMSGVDRKQADGTRKSDVQKVNTGVVTSSCGSCYLGDAFRCSSCPYLGASKAGYSSDSAIYLADSSTSAYPFSPLQVCPLSSQGRRSRSRLA